MASSPSRRRPSRHVRSHSQLIDFLDAHRVGVLASGDEVTLPRQSVVYYVRDEQRLLISTESRRLKARDIGRSG